ncbi:hypothetical protein GCM10023328_20330 [Modestobacter marinus]|uniref:Uncharacterized protein n=1 Tax=Modestobacter marinus TaxID=477641 RepID=A0A846LD82_9ACTN|nr:hypothetical protein [Modestobacter marinus]NIH65617.1 hypothetical protein [Modestobacter marinus]GGL65836.1 hypothetical protein GCM10011589_22540 [Modestobacter marinus]
MTRAGHVRRTAAGRLLVVLLGVLAVLAVAAPASAHVGGGEAGSDFDAAVRSVSPDVPGLTVRVLQFGDELEVVNATDTEVTVPGYSGEPYLRIGPDGVWRNAASPATYLNLDRYGRTPMPDGVDITAAPRWEQVSTQAQYVWHDHRTHWMTQDQLPPGVAADPSRPHTVIEWTVPMAHGGTDVVVAGVLTWSPPPPAWLVWPGYALVLAGAVAAGWFARGPRLLAGALAVGALASMYHALATPEPPSSVSSHVGAIVSALLPALLVLLAAAVGVRAAGRGSGGLTGLMAVAVGWLLLVQGLPDVDVLWTANALTAGPPVLARVAVAVLVAGGLGLVLGGVGAARRFRDGARAPVHQVDEPALS